MLHSPFPIDNAHTHEAVCASSSPAARVASSTIKNGPAKLISADKNPATTADTDTSRRIGAPRLTIAPRRRPPRPEDSPVTDLPSKE